MAGAVVGYLAALFASTIQETQGRVVADNAWLQVPLNPAIVIRVKLEVMGENSTGATQLFEANSPGG